MEHIFHLKEHLSSHGELWSLSSQWNLFNQLPSMMGEQSGKLRTFQRQGKQLPWSYSSNTGESNWLSAMWERSSTNNSHLRHQNKVLVSALGKKMGSCSSSPHGKMRKFRTQWWWLVLYRLLTWLRKRNNEMMQPNPKPWFYCKTIEVHLLEKGKLRCVFRNKNPQHPEYFSCS